MILKILDLYINGLGLLGVPLSIGVMIFTLYLVVIRKNIKALLILISLGVLLYFKSVNQILAVGAIAVMYIQVGFFIYFLIRGLRLKNKLPQKVITEYPQVAIIIPAKNESQVITETLLSISQLDYPSAKLEIIVIDDGSTDNTYHLVTALNLKNLVIVRHPASRGKANSINEILTDLKAEYLLILDADHLIDKDFLKIALADFVSPDIVCVQGKNIVRNGNTNLLSRLVQMEYEERYEIILNGRGLPQFMGSAGVFNTKMLREMGGFNPKALTEDFEFSHRAYLKNYRIVFDSKLKTYELACLDVKNFFVQRHRWFRGNWHTLVHFGKDLFTSQQISTPNKLELINNYIELAALFSYLFVSIILALDFLKIETFPFRYYAYVPYLSLFMLHAFTVFNSKKYILFAFLLFIPFYYILYAIPDFMALMDNWVLQSEYKWNKSERSLPKVPRRMISEEEIAAVTNRDI